MTNVVVTGAASPLGRKVRALLASHPDVDAVIGVDDAAVTGHGVRSERVDLMTGDLAGAFAGADAILHLATGFGPELDAADGSGAADAAMARRVLDAADAAGAGSVVLVTSATVYGPWPNNAVPLAEDAPLRPHPDLPFAVQMAEVERLAAEWAAEHPEVTVTRLRPGTVVADPERGWLADALDAAGKLPPGDETPAQYLHVDDLASAVVAAWEARVDGPANVVPPGWLTPTERRALDPVPRIRLPERWALAIATWRWRVGLAPTPPGVLAYARQSWVVAPDRLLAVGWEPEHSNEEAYVAGHEASVMEQISPQRRQEIALGVLGATVIAGAVGAGLFIRRRRRRRG